jgi:hypothetical protein
MNAMGHDVKTFIGVNKKDLARTIRRLVPDYVPMGAAGMAEMGEMEMPMPDNTLPMMTGFGQFGPMEMGGMFSVVKVREGIAHDDYTDPGSYKYPPGTVAYEVASIAAAPLTRKSDKPSRAPATEFNVIKARQQETDQASTLRIDHANESYLRWACPLIGRHRSRASGRRACAFFGGRARQSEETGAGDRSHHERGRRHDEL